MPDERSHDLDAALASAIEALSFGLVAVTARAIDDARPSHPLTFQQWRILVVLGSSESGVRIGEVAERIGASRPSTSRLIHRLSRRGLIDSRPDPDDGRASSLRLTEAGTILRRTILARRRVLIEESLDGEVGVAGAASTVERLARRFQRWL